MLESTVTIRSESLPVLATAIHNGHGLPTELLSICGINEADRLREEDPKTEEFAALFQNHMIVQTSRFAIDLNRSPEKAVYLKPEDCWGLPVRTEPIPDDVLRQLQADYASWYALLKYQINRLLGIHPFLVVLDLHSYNHRRGGPDALPDPQLQNPDIIVGRSNLAEQHYSAANALAALLDGKPYQGGLLDCRMDVKFTGGYLSRWLNHHYSDRLICLAVEFKKTWMDEWNGAVDTDSFSCLKAIFRTAIQTWLSQIYGIA